MSDKEDSKEQLWFLDSSCSNHNCDKKELFNKLDESLSTFLKLGDNSNMIMIGKRNVQMIVNGIM